MSEQSVISWTCLVLGIVAGLQWYEIRKLRRRIESVNVTMWALQFATQGLLTAEEANAFGAQTAPPEEMRRLTGPRIIEQSRKLDDDRRARAQRDVDRTRGRGFETTGGMSSRAHRPPGWS